MHIRIVFELSEEEKQTKEMTEFVKGLQLFLPAGIKEAGEKALQAVKTTMEQKFAQRGVQKFQIGFTTGFYMRMCKEMQFVQGGSVGR